MELIKLSICINSPIKDIKDTISTCELCSTRIHTSFIHFNVHTTSSKAHTLLTFSTDLSLSPIKREPFPGPFKKTKSVVLSLSRQHHGLPRASLKWHVTRPYHQWILHPMSSMKMTIASSGT